MPDSSARVKGFFAIALEYNHKEIAYFLFEAKIQSEHTANILTVKIQLFVVKYFPCTTSAL